MKNPKPMALDQFNPASQHHRPLLVSANVPYAVDNRRYSRMRRNVQRAAQAADQPFIVQLPTALTGRVQPKWTTVRALHHEAVVVSEDRTSVQTTKGAHGITGVNLAWNNCFGFLEYMQCLDFSIVQATFHGIATSHEKQGRQIDGLLVQRELHSNTSLKQATDQDLLLCSL